MIGLVHLRDSNPDYLLWLGSIEIMSKQQMALTLVSAAIN
jgi:hypothetical protein